MARACLSGCTCMLGNPEITSFKDKATLSYNVFCFSSIANVIFVYWSSNTLRKTCRRTPIVRSGLDIDTTLVFSVFLQLPGCTQLFIVLCFLVSVCSSIQRFFSFKVQKIKWNLVYVLSGRSAIMLFSEVFSIFYISFIRKLPNRLGSPDDWFCFNFCTLRPCARQFS